MTDWLEYLARLAEERRLRDKDAVASRWEHWLWADMYCDDDDDEGSNDTEETDNEAL